MKNSKLTLLIISFFILTFSLRSEIVPGPETQASVKELFDFHEVIVVIWHEAWPAKNIEQLKQLQPDVEKGVASVVNAKLPGILRDKQAKWDEGVAKLNSISQDYKKACLDSDPKTLLDAAENLHMQFERLVRIIRPAFKELDAYHVELYKLYHYYMPEYDYDKIVSSVENLGKLIEPLMSADVPKRIAKKSDEFNTARNELKASLEALSGAVKSGNDKVRISDAVEKMHSKYQGLDHIFE